MFIKIPSQVKYYIYIYIYIYHKNKILIDFMKSNLFVSGSLPTQIGNLTALVNFEVHTNSFSGKIL